MLRRTVWTGGCLGVAVFVVLLLQVGLPFVLLELGVRSHFEWTLFRVGHHESHRSLDLAERVPGDGSALTRRVGGYVLAREGERLILDYRASTRRGRATLVVNEAVGGSDPLWRVRWPETEGPGDEARYAGVDTVAVPTSGLLALRVFLRDWGGSLEVDWRVE